MSSAAGGGTVVIGLGNPLMGDDGLGLATLGTIRSGWEFDPPITLLDGGTWGMNLLHDIEGADRLLLIDAINVAQSPGTLVVLERDELPRYFAVKLSPHQIDLKEVLALAELRGTMPARIVALGLQPDRIELSTSLSSALADGVPSLVERIIQLLEDWGHCPRPRNGGAARA